MVESEEFKFPCPHCGQHLEVEFDMVGMTIDCPGCGQPFEVPPFDNECQADAVSDEKVETKETTCGRGPKIAVIKRRASFAARCKTRLKAIGVGVGVLLLFVGVGVVFQLGGEHTSAGGTSEGSGSAEARKGRGWRNGSAKRQVVESVECLLDLMRLPNERRLKVLADSLKGCPDKFQKAVSEYVAIAFKSPEDMISTKEKEDAMKTTAGAAILFGILGAASSGDSQRGVNAGLELGDMAYQELKEKAKRRLKDEIEEKRNRLIEVAQTYGIDSNAFEEALVSRER